MKGTAGQLRKALELIPDDVYVVFPDGSDNLPGLAYWNGDNTFSEDAWLPTGEPPRPFIRSRHGEYQVVAVYDPEHYVPVPYKPGDTIIFLNPGDAYIPPRQERRRDYSASRFR